MRQPRGSFGHTPTSMSGHAPQESTPFGATNVRELLFAFAARAHVTRALLVTALAASSLASTACESREEKAVGLLEEMGRAMEKHDGDCDKLATELTRLRKDNGDAMKALADSDKLGPDERKAFDAKYQKRIDRAMQKMVEHAAACRDNPKIAEAMDVR